jgi:large-conductance mechanosensitive channel
MSMSEIFTKVEKLARRGVIVEFKEFINRGNVIDLAVALGFLITYAIYVTLVFFQSKIIGPDDVRAPRNSEVSTSNNKTPIPG